MAVGGLIGGCLASVGVWLAAFLVAGRGENHENGKVVVGVAARLVGERHQSLAQNHDHGNENRGENDGELEECDGEFHFEE